MLNLYKPQGLPVFALFFFSFLLFATPKIFSQQYALQFDGSNDYVAFGSAVGPNGILMPSGTPPTWVNPSGVLGSYALQFSSSSLQYVTFGQATTTLGALTFTLECWFNWTGGGVTTSTGTGGLTTVIPLVTKGRGEADGDNRDMNYFLGIQGGKLAADFEDIDAASVDGDAAGQNQPIFGTITITTNVWHHAAATFDGTIWRLYLDGVLDNSLDVTNPGYSPPRPQLNSIQYAGIGSALNSTGVAAGFFQGIIDEARIWNYARSQSEIQTSMNSEIENASGLLGRWGLNEGVGTGANCTSTFNPNLGLTQFTLECWVKRNSGGATMTTGTGGIPAIYPVLTKGMGEGETPANINTNWFLGITSAGNIGADFEDNNGGVNHPITGIATVPLGEWHHIAATYNGQIWNLYFDGVLDQTLTLSSPYTPENRSIQHAALSAGIGSTGQLSTGFFAGIIDEARVWNYPRTQTDIQNSMVQEITSAPGLVARWGLNEGTGTTANNSNTNNLTPGTLTNGPPWVTGISFPTELWALQFNGSSNYVTFGSASGLATQTFTVETWFKRTGTGVANTTGTDGIDIIPLVAKGAPDVDGSVVDANYILGINSATNTIAADFEEGTGSNSPGQNHPIWGTTVIQNDVWYHAAVTFSSSGDFKVYLNGFEEASLSLGAYIWPQGNSTQHSSLGTMLKSDGTNSSPSGGYFEGALDEVRIWDFAKTVSEIQTSINSEITTSQTGLLARWALDEGFGTDVISSAGTTFNGTIQNSGYSWVFGAPFDITFTPPAAPTSLSATAGSGNQIELEWADNSNDEQGFQIERSTNAGGPFTLVKSATANNTNYVDPNLQ